MLSTRKSEQPAELSTLSPLGLQGMFSESERALLVTAGPHEECLSAPENAVSMLVTISPLEVFLPLHNHLPDL